MDRVSLPDLDSLDRDALLALFRAQQQQLQEEVDAMIAAHEQELRRLEAELEQHRQTLSEQGR